MRRASPTTTGELLRGTDAFFSVPAAWVAVPPPLPVRVAGPPARRRVGAVDGKDQRAADAQRRPAVAVDGVVPQLPVGPHPRPILRVQAGGALVPEVDVQAVALDHRR